MGTEKSLKSDPTFSKSINSSRMIILEKLIFPLLGDSTFQRDIELRKDSKKLQTEEIMKALTFLYFFVFIIYFSSDYGLHKGATLPYPYQIPPDGLKPRHFERGGGFELLSTGSLFQIILTF